jgi:hypothetical protein
LTQTPLDAQPLENDLICEVNSQHFARAMLARRPAVTYDALHTVLGRSVGHDVETA